MIAPNDRQRLVEDDVGVWRGIEEGSQVQRVEIGVPEQAQSPDIGRRCVGTDIIINSPLGPC